MTRLLEVRDLTVAYGEAIAIERISFAVERGEFVTFIGPNGAGKTTLLNTIMGILRPRSGALLMNGQDLSRLRPERRVAQGVVLVPERRELFVRLTVQDNLRLGGFLRRSRGRSGLAADLDRVYAIFPKLGERRAQFAGTLSGGEQQMLAVGRALMAAPTILMLDEPSTGLAPRIMEEIFATIASLKAEGTTGILVEQNARAALAVADRAYVLETGNVVVSGTASDLASDPRVVAAYLGTGRSYDDAPPRSSQE